MNKFTFERFEKEYRLQLKELEKRRMEEFQRINGLLNDVRKERIEKIKLIIETTTMKKRILENWSRVLSQKNRKKKELKRLESRIVGLELVVKRLKAEKFDIEMDLYCIC